MILIRKAMKRTIQLTESELRKYVQSAINEELMKEGFFGGVSNMWNTFRGKNDPNHMRNQVRATYRQSFTNGNKAQDLEKAANTIESMGDYLNYQGFNTNDVVKQLREISSLLKRGGTQYKMDGTKIAKGSKLRDNNYNFETNGYNPNVDPIRQHLNNPDVPQLHV